MLMICPHEGVIWVRESNWRELDNADNINVKNEDGIWFIGNWRELANGDNLDVKYK